MKAHTKIIEILNYINKSEMICQAALFTLYTTIRKETTTTSAKSTQSLRVMEYFTCRGDSIDNDMEVTSMIFFK